MCWFRASEPAGPSPASPGIIKKTKGKKILSVAVEPKESPVISQKLAGEDLKPGPHKIQGIGAGFIPDTLDLSVVDRVEQVDSAEAVEFARRLAKRGRHPVGISCGAAAAVAVRLARAGRIRRQDPRRHPSRRRRALPFHRPL